jgi:cytochrome P450
LPPDRHQAIKSLSQPVFTPQRVQARREEVVTIADDLVARMKMSDELFDLFNGFARPYVGRVMMLFFGIPVDRMEALFEIADRLPLGIEGERLETDHEDIIAAMFADYNRVLDDVYSQPAPTGTLISTLQAAMREGKIGFDQTRHTINSALDGSLGTTLSFIRGMLHFFACHPDHWKSLIEEPDDIPNAVEEMLRYLSPASNFLWGRTTNDVVVNGCPMKRDDRVEFDIHAANRDPEIFQQADAFVIGREERQHLALGHGPHFCLGAALARMTGHVAIELLTKGLGELGLAKAIHPPERETQWGQIPELIIRNEKH